MNNTIIVLDFGSLDACASKAFILRFCLLTLRSRRSRLKNQKA